MQYYQVLESTTFDDDDDDDNKDETSDDGMDNIDDLSNNLHELVEFDTKS